MCIVYIWIKLYFILITNVTSVENSTESFLICYTYRVYDYLQIQCYHDMKVYSGVEVKFHALLISTLGGYEWSASCSVRLNPKERAFSAY